ncbi:hypothetical protein C8R43DRAFT_954834 [Mycena crocata]|nr:hypothetical protein C8R43DRAFT_954834 [Mycena crocata]
MGTCGLSGWSLNSSSRGFHPYFKDQASSSSGVGYAHYLQPRCAQCRPPLSNQGTSIMRELTSAPRRVRPCCRETRGKQAAGSMTQSLWDRQEHPDDNRIEGFFDSLAWKGEDLRGFSKTDHDWWQNIWNEARLAFGAYGTVKAIRACSGKDTHTSAEDSDRRPPVTARIKNSRDICDTQVLGLMVIRNIIPQSESVCEIQTWRKGAYTGDRLSPKRKWGLELGAVEVFGQEWFAIRCESENNVILNTPVTTTVETTFDAVLSVFIDNIGMTEMEIIPNFDRC